MAHERTKIFTEIANGSSTLITPSHDKRHILWKAFRKTVLEPYGIRIVEHAVSDKVPESLLGLIEEMCQNLDRHETQASSFHEAVAQGGGFGPSPIFPPEILPPGNTRVDLACCTEPAFHSETLPSLKSSTQTPAFHLPVPRPSLACGFSFEAFSENEMSNLPGWITVVGTNIDHDTGQIQPNQAIHVPFLMFERTYGRANHEIEATMNHCAVDGAAALHALSTLFDKAWSHNDLSRPAEPTVFSCVIDDDIGITCHHWIDNQGHFLAAPFCKFDLRVHTQLMRFLACVEAIEQWAIYFLLPDIKEALNMIDGTTAAKELVTPVTIEEKNEKLRRCMKLAFDNITWRNERFKGAPLAVTAAMRARTAAPGGVRNSSGSVASSYAMTRQQKSAVVADPQANEAKTITQGRTDCSSGAFLYPTTTSASYSARYSMLLSPFTVGTTLKRGGSPKRLNADLLPPLPPADSSRHNTTLPTCSSGSTISESPDVPSEADQQVRPEPSAMPSPLRSTDNSPDTTKIVPQMPAPAVQTPPLSANSLVSRLVTSLHDKKSDPENLNLQQQITAPIFSNVNMCTDYSDAPNNPSRTGTVSYITLSDATTSTKAKDIPLRLETHALPKSLILTPPQSSTASPLSSTIQHKRSLSSLYQQKRTRSPVTPESMSTSPLSLSSTTSPSTVRSKISASLGIIREHTFSRPRRVRTENSGPTTPKPGDEPLPTPAYDKRRFQMSNEQNGATQMSAWVEDVL